MKNGILGRLRYRAGFGFGAGNFQGLFSAFFYRVEGRFFAITFQMRTKKHHQKSSNLKKPSKKPKKTSKQVGQPPTKQSPKNRWFFFWDRSQKNPTYPWKTVPTKSSVRIWSPSLAEIFRGRWKVLWPKSVGKT